MLIHLCSEALRQTNLTMKERFEGLSAWREKQQEERNFLESKLEEARNHIEALTLQNQEMSGKTGEEGKSVAGGSMVRVHLVYMSTKMPRSWEMVCMMT